MHSVILWPASNLQCCLQVIRARSTGRLRMCSIRSQPEMLSDTRLVALAWCNMQPYTVSCELVLLNNIALQAWRQRPQKYLSSSQKTVASFRSRNATRVAYLRHHLCHCPEPLPQNQSAKLRAVHHHSWPTHWIQTQGRCPETLLPLMVSFPSPSSMLLGQFPVDFKWKISVYEWRRTLPEK